MGIKQWQLLSLLTVLRAKLQGIIKGILQMNYIPPIQLWLENREYQRSVLMEQAAEITALSRATAGTNCQVWRKQRWPESPSASWTPPGRARLAGLGAGRGCSGTASCTTTPKAFCRAVTAPFSRAQWGGKAHISSRQGLCAQTAGEAQLRVNFVCEFPLQSIKPTEPRK